MISITDNLIAIEFGINEIINCNEDDFHFVTSNWFDKF